VYPSKFSILE
jgi:hypothetical protein